MLKDIALISRLLCTKVAKGIGEGVGIFLRNVLTWENMKDTWNK